MIPAEDITSLKKDNVFLRVKQNPLEAGINGNSGKASSEKETLS